MNSVERAAFTPCRRRSSPATRKRGRPRKPTGRGYQRSTPSSRRLRPRQSSNSTALSPSAWPRGRKRLWRSLTVLCGTRKLKTYHLLLSVRGDLLDKLGRYGEARAEFEAAAGLAGNRRERDLLRRRAAKAAEQTNFVIVCRRTEVAGGDVRIEAKDLLPKCDRRPRVPLGRSPQPCALFRGPFFRSWRRA